MDEPRKLVWLKRILLIKVIVTWFIWGLPALLGPAGLLRLLGLSVPEDFTYLRLFGAVATAFGVAYWFAYRDPLRNQAIIRAGIVDNGLVTLTVIVLGILGGVRSWFMWGSAVLTGAFCVLFIVLLPRAEPFSARALE
jgi:hypothetical protein